MLRVIAVIGATTYYFASEPLDYDNRFWEPRISNKFELVRNFADAEKSGNRIRSMNLSLDNRDGFFNAIEVASGFLNMKVTFLFNEGTANYQKFTGKINKINSYGDDIVLNVMETGYEYLKDRFPDAQIAYDYYSANGINNSWNAVPIPFGTVNRIPLSWVNLFRSEFIIGSGPLFKVAKLYFDKVLVYDVDTGKNGYKPTPESQEIKFRVFKGTGSVGSPEIVGGVTSEYPGFAYVQLYKIVDELEVPADPITPDGETAQIYADIEGIANAGGTAAERNPAQILYNLMTKPTTGYEGYGLGLPEADLDFADAILECAVQGFLIDGVIDNTTEFDAWMNEILRCCRGNIREEDGKIKLTIDAAKIASAITFDETGETGLNCIVGTWDEPELESQINRIRLSYSWNFERNDFNKKPGVHEESPLEDPNLKDETHALRISKWNTDVLEFKLIKDDTTAHKLTQYYLKNGTKQLKRTSIVTEVEIGALDCGDVIKLTSPKYGWVEKEFLITSIERGQTETTINLKEYSDDVFVFVDPGTGAEDSGQPYSIYNIPAKPTLNSLTVVNDLLKDGTVQTKINATFTRPATNVYLVALYYKLVAEPDSAFKPLDFTISETEISAIWKGNETGDYNFRLVSVSPVGIYSDIAIESGDLHYYGQPGAESFKTLEGDSIAPGTPSISDLNPIIGGVSFYINIVDGIPDDFSYFKVYRKIGANPETLLDANYASRLFSDIDRGAGYDARIYSVTAVDTSGNESPRSAWSASVIPLQVKNGDLEAESVTTDKLTAQQIIAKDFRTACNVGNGTVSGVMLTSAGLQAWNGACRTVNITNAGNVEISGTITATAGVIGGWCAAAGCLYSSNIGLLANGSIQTLNFVSGNCGWKIDCIGNAEFNNIYARGAIKTVVFEKDEISVVGGCTMIRPAGLSKFDCTPSANFTMYVDQNVDQFAVNDIVRIKDGGNDIWGRVYCCGCNTSGCYILITRCSGSYFAITKGQAIINYGSCAGCGGIMLNGQSPYIDLYTHGGTPWLGTDSRVRIGNLDGWGTISGNTYGIAAGCPTGQYMTYDSVSGVLNIKGSIIIGSSGISNFSDAGALATANTLDDVPDGSYTAKTYYGSSLVNNYSLSNTITGWSACSGLITTTKDGVDVRAHAISTNQCVGAYSSCFVVDPSQMYKITMSIKKDISGGTHYIGICAYDCNCVAIPVWLIDTNLGSCSEPPTGNPYLVSGVASTTSWQNYELYLLPEHLQEKDVPKGLNATKHIKLPANTKYVRLRYLNWANAGVTRVMHVFAPSVVNVDTSNQNSLYRGLDSAGTLISRVIPTCTASPTSDGLYLGSDYMGYYNAGWKTYMDNTGKFYLTGASGGLAWDGSSLTVCGTICSSNGNISGWLICDNRIYRTFADCASISLGGWPTDGSNCGAIYIVANCSSSACGTISIGNYLRLASGFDGTLMGISIIGKGSNQMFRATMDRATGSNFCGLLAGWGFNVGCLYSGNLIMNSSGAITGNYSGDVSGWCIDSSGNAKFNTAIIRGTVYATVGCIGGWRLGSTYLDSRVAGCGSIYLCSGTHTMLVGACTADALLGYLSFGKMYYSGDYLNAMGFSVGLCGPSLPVAIGVATLGTVALPSGTTVAATCPFFYVGSGSTAYMQYYNGVLTVKGVICATSGNVGCFCICDGNLYSRILNVSDCGKFELFNSSGNPQLCITFCCTSTATTMSTFSVNSWYDGSTKDWAPFRVYSNGNYTAYFQKIICVGLRIQTPAIWSQYLCANRSDGFSHSIVGCNSLCIGIYGWACCNAGVLGCAANCGVVGCAGSFAVYGYATSGYAVAGNSSYYNSSTRSLKQNFEDIRVLSGLRTICIQKWAWADINQRGFDEFVAPTAEDVANAWGLTFKDDGYYTLDGIALKAAQEIDENVQVHDQCICSLESCVSTLEARLKMIEERIGIN